MLHIAPTQLVSVVLVASRCVYELPEISGPAMPPIVSVIPIAAATRPFFSGGTALRAMIMVMEYRPLPPMPCNARHTILNGQCSSRDHGGTQDHIQTNHTLTDGASQGSDHEYDERCDLNDLPTEYVAQPGYDNGKC